MLNVSNASHDYNERSCIEFAHTTCSVASLLLSFDGLISFIPRKDAYVYAELYFQHIIRVRITMGDLQSVNICFIFNPRLNEIKLQLQRTSIDGDTLIGSTMEERYTPPNNIDIEEAKTFLAQRIYKRIANSLK